MIVAGVDLSLTATGISVFDRGQPLTLEKLGWPGKSAASDTERFERIVALRHLIVARIRTFHPDIVIIESPSYGSHPLPSTVDRNILWGIVGHEFARPTAPERYVGVAPKCLKRFVTGNGNASKALMVETLTTWLPEHRALRNDNIADSAGLALMGTAWAGDPLPFELRRVQRESLEAVAWPVMT